MHTKKKSMKNKENMESTLSCINAPKDNDTEMYAYILYVYYLINKVNLVEFPLRGVKEDYGNGTYRHPISLPHSLRGSKIR